MTDSQYHFVVIGAGSGGLVVASGAAGLGARVALVEAEKMGGDCLNFGCVPSKSLLRAAHLAADIRRAESVGLSASLDEVDLGRVMDRVRSVVAEIEPHDSRERFEGLGVDVFEGRAVVAGPHSVRVGDTILRTRNIVVATGSSPAVPPIPGLAETPHLTNRTVFDLRSLPEHLVVLGAGPIGLELGQGFAQLGSRVTLVDMAPALFGRDDPEVGPLMEEVLRRDGLDLELGAKIVSVAGNEREISVTVERDGPRRTISGDRLLVALGRVPNTRGLGLEEAGVRIDGRGFIEVDGHMRTSVPSIWACGDVTGPYLFTHTAGYQAALIVRNAIFPFRARADDSAVPWTTYTKPEVAHVGLTEPVARERGVLTDTVSVDLERLDRARTEGDRAGFLKLVL
ncbi:MAG TPA: hypothetical protein ENK19_05450, partial [Acidobacteria bacterium]|nr:hypothetical protein [Acidobacteriota bacterium]